MNTEHLKQSFFEYWERRVNSGVSSGLSRVEVLLIDIFVDWLFESGDYYLDNHYL